MSVIAKTPKPPYYAVIFSNLRTHDGQVEDGYADMAERMSVLAAQQPGFLGFESAREGLGAVACLGITVSYWQDLESIKAWKANAEHLEAQRLGHEKWYSSFKTRIARVERDYEM